MQISGLYSADLQNGSGVGVTLGTAGCCKRCEGCFNSKFWALNSGVKYTEAHKKQVLELVSKDYIDHFSIIGGEPLLPQNYKDLFELCWAIKTAKPNIKIWLWSGYTWDEIWEHSIQDKTGYLTDLLDLIDILVDGPFVQEKKDIALKWRGSSNQRVIDCAATLAARNKENLDCPEPILYCE